MLAARRTLHLLICLPLLCLLAACAGRPTMPAAIPDLSLPMQLQVERLQHAGGDKSVMVIQQEGSALRFSLFDPMGAPIARQLLENSQWKRDGLLPPNPEARELFAAVLFALTDEAELSDIYPDDDWRVTDNRRTLYLGNKPRWQAFYGQQDDIELRIAGDARYQVIPMQETGAAQP
jgi:hypothetical protein